MARTNQATGGPDGVIVVDKPRGPTSHDVVARARRAVKSRHVGHAGTLDPMATGVLVLAVGEATKLVPWLTAHDKTYEATVRLGVDTDTLDAEGTETARVLVPPDVLRALLAWPAPSTILDAAILLERARTSQVPPAFSAIRIGGERAHELARAGRLESDLPARSVAVRTLEITGATCGDEVVELSVRIHVAKGYFVRSLARDLARGLGTVGHLTALRRTHSGAFSLDEALTVDRIGRDTLIPISHAASRALPVTILDAAGVRAVSFGQRVAPEQMTEPHPCPSAWLDGSARLVAIGECDADGSGRVLRGFPSVSPP